MAIGEDAVESEPIDLYMNVNAIPELIPEALDIE